MWECLGFVDSRFQALPLWQPHSTPLLKRLGLSHGPPYTSRPLKRLKKALLSAPALALQDLTKPVTLYRGMSRKRKWGSDLSSGAIKITCGILVKKKKQKTKQTKKQTKETKNKKQKTNKQTNKKTRPSVQWMAIVLKSYRCFGPTSQRC